jgi:hypothetical protein
MAINTYRLWMATDSNRLLANQFAFIGAPAPSFYQGNVAQLELHIVASSGVGSAPIEVPFPAGAAITVAVGDTNKYPTGGTWELTVDSTETEPVPYNATTTQLQDALNAIAAVDDEGGVTVTKTGTGYTITWNTYGLKPTISQGSDTLTPSAYESISLVQVGDAGTRQIVFVELRQSPIAMSTTWTPLSSPVVTTTLIQAWSGTNKIYRVGIDPQPRAGTIQITFGTVNQTFNYNTSASSMATALGSQVFQTGQYQWDIVLTDDETLTATGLLIGYNGYVGTINFSTAECHQFLGGESRRSTNIEVSMNVSGDQFTLLQAGCNVFADVVAGGAVVPIPLGAYLDEAVANARFVRRDLSQSPDYATVDVIWGNLGVVLDGSDIAAAINSTTHAPTAINPIATLADLTASGLTVGTLSNGATTTLDSTVPTAGQALTYDGTDLIWATVGGGGGSFLPLAGGTMTGAITFDAVGLQNVAKGTFDNGTGGYQGISLTCAVGYELNWQGGRLTNWYSGSAQQIIFDSPLNIASAGGITFSDTTVQTTAFPGFSGYAPLASPSFTGGITSDGGVTVPGPSGNATFTYSGINLSPSGTGGITFSDSTVQTTAATPGVTYKQSIALAVTAGYQNGPYWSGSYYVTGFYYPSSGTINNDWIVAGKFKVQINGYLFGWSYLSAGAQYLNTIDDTSTFSPTGTGETLYLYYDGEASPYPFLIT